MLFVISPAKTLDFATPAQIKTYTQPEFLAHSQQLIDVLRAYSPAQISQLMSISDSLAALNVARFAEWQPPFTTENAKQALLAFNGDVYEGLNAATLTKKGLDYAQAHLRILSGLYGLLRPLDLMQAYRLEMGTRLINPHGRDLYAFWGDRLTHAINAEMKANKEAKVLVNLASEEYFKALQPKAGESLQARVITPVFEDWKNGKYKIISFYAKRARGLMVRYAIDHAVKKPEALQAFNYEGYAFVPQDSSADQWVFRRKVVGETA